MALIESKNLVSIADASKRGLSALVRQAEAGETQIVLRNNRPVAAIVSMDTLETFQPAATPWPIRYWRMRGP